MFGTTLLITITLHIHLLQHYGFHVW
uniref:ATATH7 n=1 Tax=Arundo donax TaxID=35708 RepID=A0A0A9ES45_ARUDO